MASKRFAFEHATDAALATNEANDNSHIMCAMAEDTRDTGGGGRLQGATLCLSLQAPLTADATATRGREHYVTWYHDNGELSGWQRVEELTRPFTAPALNPRVVWFRRLETGRLDVFAVLNPSDVSNLFESRDFDGWDESVRSVLRAALNSDVDRDWKDAFASVLVLEDAERPTLPSDADAMHVYVHTWLAGLGVADTVAYPCRLGETILISAPHVMGTRAADRTVCALTRPHPVTIKSEDLALSRSVIELLDCWHDAIGIINLRRDLHRDPFATSGQKAYLDRIAWSKAGRRKRLVLYERQFLTDLETSTELVTRARRVVADTEARLRFNRFRRLTETATTVPVGKRSHMAYPVSAVVASTIERPFSDLDAAVVTIENRREGTSNYLRDATAVHIDLSNWHMQWTVLVLTIATIVFGAASLYLDWKTYVTSQQPASDQTQQAR